MTGITPDTEVRFLPGVGPRRAAALAEVGIVRAGDLLLRLPFRYEDRSERRSVGELADGDSAAAEVLIASLNVRPTRRRNLRIVELRGHDASGPVKATWFNQVHLKQILRPGQRVLLFGKVKRPFAGAVPEFANPGYELVTGEREGSAAGSPAGLPEAGGAPAEPDPGGGGPGAHAGRIVPIYERVGSLTPRLLRTVLHRLLEDGAAVGPGQLPEELVGRMGLPSRGQALEAVHFPPDGASLAEFERRRSSAHQRLILEEFFVFALGLRLRRRQDRVGRPGPPHLHRGRRPPGPRPPGAALPPDVVAAGRPRHHRGGVPVPARHAAAAPGRRGFREDDRGGHRGAHRHPPRGAGGAHGAHRGPRRAALRDHPGAPRTAPHPGRAAHRRTRRRGAPRHAAGGGERLGPVRGRHAFADPGRAPGSGTSASPSWTSSTASGSRSAATLVERGGGADLLVMTATPIPRTLTMALHGDLDLSELRELPPGRQPVGTLIRDAAGLSDVYARVREEVRKGRQAFYVCPLIEESEELPGAGVEARFRELSQGPFRGLRVDLVHGRVPAARRERVMSAFASGELDVLVATTVIEVGVDVPNATVMVVEHAERFGLAQLHQLRGRVGRGSDPATAILVVGGKPTDSARRRLEVLEATTDGFRIAEEDLAIRGPGDFLGTRQSGIPPFRVADIVRDAEFLRLARKEASDFLASPAAETDEGTRILAHVQETWGERFGLTAGG